MKTRIGAMMGLTTKADEVHPLFLCEKSEFESKIETEWQRRILNSYDWNADKQKFILMSNEEGRIDKVCAIYSAQKLKEDPREFYRIFARLANELPPKTFELQTEISDQEKELAALGWLMGQYDFDYFKKSKARKEKPQFLMRDQNLLERAQRAYQAVKTTRDLVNLPNNEMHPEDLAELAKDFAEKYNASCKIIEGKKLLAENYPTIYTVGMASDYEPLLIDLNWGNESHPEIVLVGKGVCFDSGGYNIKPASGMRNMKKDMGGAAHALALAEWIMAAKLPIRLRLLVPAVENRISDEGFVPGDIIKTRKGIYVEIDNTDAEGRLVLCDALAEASESNPEWIFDFATLTGACRIALGEDLPGYFTDSDDLAAQLQLSARKCADPIWRLPLWAPYKRMLKSTVADMLNSAPSGFAGAITAALYLKEFVNDPKKWAHFDVYAWTDHKNPASFPGGECYAIRAVFDFLERTYCS